MPALLDLVQFLFYVINLLILARILLSWLPMAGIHLDPYNPIVRVLMQLTDPILEPFRRLIPPMGGMDFSPLVAVLVLQLVQSIILSLLAGATY